jgi:hypothetical protein
LLILILRTCKREGSEVALGYHSFCVPMYHQMYLNIFVIHSDKTSYKDRRHL